MSDPAVDRWKPTGKIYFWIFPEDARNYPGWNCHVDRDGCNSVIELLDLMIAAPWSSSRTVTLTTTDPEIARRAGEGSIWHGAKQLRIVHPQAQVTETSWEWSGSFFTPALTLGREKLVDLRTGYQRVASGDWDFCVHADDQQVHGIDRSKMSIWFW